METIIKDYATRTCKICVELDCAAEEDRSRNSEFWIGESKSPCKFCSSVTMLM